MPKKFRHDGAIDNGKALETAGARPMSDPRDLEKTFNAPHSDHLKFAYHSHTNLEPGLQVRLSDSIAAAKTVLFTVLLPITVLQTKIKRRCPCGLFAELFDFVLLELELIQTQMAQKPMLRAEVGMRVRCANKARASAE